MSLTEEEHEALALTFKLGEKILVVIGDGPHANTDWQEMTIHLHAIQNAILAQSAARIHSDQYRLLGE